MNWTRSRLMRALYTALRSPTVTIERAAFDPLSHSAQVLYEWHGRTLEARVRVDGAQDGQVTMALHELLHPHLDETLEQAGLDDELAEYAIAGIEAGLVARLKRSPRAYARWRTALTKKQEGA